MVRVLDYAISLGSRLTHVSLRIVKTCYCKSTSLLYIQQTYSISMQFCRFFLSNISYFGDSSIDLYQIGPTCQILDGINTYGDGSKNIQLGKHNEELISKAHIKL